MLPGGVRNCQLILPVDDCPLLSGSVWAEEIDIIASVNRQIQTTPKQLCISWFTDFRSESFIPDAQ
jgi:hypothetical protein